MIHFVEKKCEEHAEGSQGVFKPPRTSQNKKWGRKMDHGSCRPKRKSRTDGSDSTGHLMGLLLLIILQSIIVC